MKKYYLFENAGSLKILIALFSLSTLFYGCTEVDYEPEPVSTVAAFSYNQSEDNPATVYFDNYSQNALSYSWNFGDGTHSNYTYPDHTYAESGTYTITLTAMGQYNSSTTSQVIKIQLEDEVTPTGNIIKGSTLDLDSEEFWSIYSAGAPENTITEFTEEGLKFYGEGQMNVMVWQPIDLEVGTYQLSGWASASEESVDSWFQIFLTNEAPVDEVDYNTSPFINMHSWSENCAISSPFQGELASLDCEGDSASNNGSDLIHISSEGKYYFIIKCGTVAYLANGGITLTDLGLVKVDL